MLRMACGRVLSDSGYTCTVPAPPHVCVVCGLRYVFSIEKRGLLARGHSTLSTESLAFVPSAQCSRSPARPREKHFRIQKAGRAPFFYLLSRTVP